MMAKTYLDWAATAPLSPAAADAMAAAAARLASGEWANPSSQHGPGRAARRAVEDARRTIAAFLAVPADAILFTSGGTEALALALGGAESAARAVMATEHSAVLEGAPDAARLPVGPDGRLRDDALDGIAGDMLVAVQQANSETGVVQDLAAIAARVHAAGGRLLSDCVQSAGKLALPAGADFVAVSAHKLGGPPGVGALVVRSKDRFRGVQRGGGQEGGYRGGTANLAGIIGFAAAVEALPRDWPARAAALQARLEAGVLAAGGEVNARGAPRLPTISSIRLPGLPGANAMMALDLQGISVSVGSACSSGTLRPSHVLGAMGLLEAAVESIRVSTGWTTTEADIDRFLEVWGGLSRRRAA
jgi:cysteine desulfurase